MRVIVSRRIDCNDKMEEKTVEAEVEESFSWIRSEEQRASEMARALFESMDPPLQVVEQTAFSKFCDHTVDKMKEGMVDPVKHEEDLADIRTILPKEGSTILFLCGKYLVASSVIKPGKGAGFIEITIEAEEVK